MPASDASLFDDIFDHGGQGSSIVPAHVKRPRSRKEQAVNRLLKQVETARAMLLREKRRLDDALVFHAAELSPRVQRLAALRADMVRALAPFLDDRRLKKAERKLVQSVVVAQLEEVLLHNPSLDDQLKAVFARVHAIGFDEAVQEDLEEARAAMKAMFDDLALDVDVPELRLDMSAEEVAAAAAAAVEQLRERQQKEDLARASARRRRRPTNRALREEERSRRWEQVRKVGIGAVYKRLVKALHPDLEPDASERARKGEVMREVTTAYGRNDLHALLLLELQWLGGDASAAGPQASETLDAYTQLLKQQAAALRTELGELPYQPRYQALMVEAGPFGFPISIDGPSEVERLDFVIGDIRASLERLASERSLAEVGEIIRAHRAATGARRRS